MKEAEIDVWVWCAKFYPTNTDDGRTITKTTNDDDHDGRLVDKYPYASKWMARKPKAASGYIWVLNGTG